MIKIKETESGAWVAVPDNVVYGRELEDIASEVANRIKAVQVFFLDLDDNHCGSPAKKIAKHAIGTSHFSPAYLSWCVRTAYALAIDGKAAESRTWFDYVDRFLRSDEALKHVREIFNEDEARRSLYPGVMGLYGMLEAAKYYVTRNIAEIAEAHTEVINANGYFAEAKDKKSVVEKFILRNPSLKRFGVDGDSTEDGEMVDVLTHYGRDVIGIYSMDRLKDDKFDNMFDIAVSKGRSGLVAIIKEN